MTYEANGAGNACVLTMDDRFCERESVQLSKLSSVLNGLEGGAQIMQRHVQDAVHAVKRGTYRVDPLQLSKRIIGEALRSL